VHAHGLSHKNVMIECIRLTVPLAALESFELHKSQKIKGISKENWNSLLFDGQLSGDILEKCSLLVLDKFVNAVSSTPLNFGEFFYISALQFDGIKAHFDRPDAPFQSRFPSSQLLIVSIDFNVCLPYILH
jgi:hypothetical protein